MDDIEKSYKILNLPPDASLEEVKQAYRHLAFVWHPDRYPQDAQLQAKAEEKFQEINQAYHTLRSYLRHPAPRPVVPSQPKPPTPSSVRSAQRPKPPIIQPPPPVFPIGWLTGTFLSYTLTGWILTELLIPSWTWIFVGLAWFAVTISACDHSELLQPWLMALIFAGTIGGWIVGNEAGGLVTATVWAFVGAALGAIAGSDASAKSVIWVFTLAGISGIAGLVAGTRTGNWFGSVLGGLIGALMGFMLGIILDAFFKSRAKIGTGSIFGFGFGGWLGAAMGAGEKTMTRIVERMQPDVIIGAWGAIAVITAVVAQMVAGEKLLASYNGFYTFLILVATSGLGLSFGWWLAN